MEFKSLHCKACGGTLKLAGAGIYQCENNPSHQFKEESIFEQREQLLSLFGEALCAQNEELIANARYNLWEATHRENIDNNEVKKYCLKIKEYLPDDFHANLYLNAVTGSVSDVNKLLRCVDVEKEYVEDIISFLLNPLEPEYVLDMSYLIERAFMRGKDIDPRYEKYMTALEEKQRLSDSGIYEETCPRDVFIAYKSEDIEKVTELCEYLESNGLTCFVSQRNLKHGVGARNLYDERLKRAMDSCSVLVFVSSKLSRTTGDARKKELSYIRQKDISRAPSEFAHKYAEIPQKYKMPRVEYLIERRSLMPNERFIDEFFDGYQWRESCEAVYFAVKEFLDGSGEENVDGAADNQPKIKYCKVCGEECLATANFCGKCKATEFVDTYGEYEEIQRIKKEKEIEEKLKQEEKENKVETRREKMTGLRNKLTGLGGKAGGVFLKITCAKKLLGFILLGLAFFNFIFALTDNVVFPSSNGIAWTTTCIVLFVVVLWSMIVSIFFGLFLDDEADAGSVWLANFISLIVNFFTIGGSLMLGWSYNAEFGWAITYAVIGGVATIVASVVTFCISRENAPHMVLFFIALYALGLTLSGGLYALVKAGVIAPYVYKNPFK